MALSHAQPLTESVPGWCRALSFLNGFLRQLRSHRTTSDMLSRLAHDVVEKGGRETTADAKSACGDNKVT
jgi:hypothetical protein